MSEVSNLIFEMEHSNKQVLTPLKDLHNEEYNKLINKFNLDVDKFYKVEGKLYPYCYSDGTVFVEIYNMTEEYFKGFMVAGVIQTQYSTHEKCIKDKDFNRLFVLIDKPFRIHWFIKLFEQIPNEQKYEIFQFVYGTSEYGFEMFTREFISEIIKYNNKDNKAKLNDVVTIYRGENSKSTSYTKAYSWTTSLKVAEFFADRFDRNSGKIYTGKVKKEDILDYIDREDEVLVFSENVFDIKQIR